MIKNKISHRRCHCLYTLVPGLVGALARKPPQLAQLPYLLDSNTQEPEGLCTVALASLVIGTHGSKRGVQEAGGISDCASPVYSLPQT